MSFTGIPSSSTLLASAFPPRNQIRGSAPRAGLEDLNPRNQAKWHKYVQFLREGLAANDGNRCANLSVGCGASGRGYDHLLGYRAYLQRQNKSGSSLAADVNLGTFLVRESRRPPAHSVPPGAERRKDKLS